MDNGATSAVAEVQSDTSQIVLNYGAFRPFRLRRYTQKYVAGFSDRATHIPQQRSIGNAIPSAARSCALYGENSDPAISSTTWEKQT